MSRQSKAKRAAPASATTSQTALARKPSMTTSFRAIRMPNTYPQLNPHTRRNMMPCGILPGSIRFNAPAKKQNNPSTV
ncbi:MAG: hypothetical protein AUF60_02545 [Gemmatimonadetes bacterium 13_1_20CM_69_28]|nr:MAG: hypothetical protein AUF60_02545 [Gemmatimonadetes bacterium 13_1_20CM_69_28]